MRQNEPLYTESRAVKGSANLLKFLEPSVKKWMKRCIVWRDENYEGVDKKLTFSNRENCFEWNKLQKEKKTIL